MKMKLSAYSSFVLVMAMVSLLKNSSADPTDGFSEVPLTEDNFLIQKPYDKPLNERYSYKNGIRRFWVYENDKPFKVGSPTRPRTEVRIKVKL